MMRKHRNEIAPLSPAGFTLLEMLTVVAIMAAVAVASIYVYDGTSESESAQNNDSVENKIAQSEMIELAKALRQFKRDVGKYPLVADPQLTTAPVFHPADFSQLYVFQDTQNNSTQHSTDDGLDDRGGYGKFDKDTGRGWKGPYLERHGIECAVFSGYANVNNGIATLAKMDPFKHGQLPSGLRWRKYSSSNTCEDNNDTNQLVTGRLGGPYLLFGITTGQKPRVVSTGFDGIYSGDNESDACLPAPKSDDLVLCL